jgi:sugar phosphate isomerase/epimerase
MKISVSNLAFPVDGKNQSYSILSENGATGIEVAPTKLAPWSNLTPKTCADEVELLKNFGLEVSSLQAIFFDKPQCQLLGNQEEFNHFCEHICLLGDIALALGTNIAVFGAPKNRKLGGLTMDNALELAIERLTYVASLLSRTGLILAIEPVPHVYGNDFLIHYNEIIDVVNQIDSPFIKLHLDTACLLLSEADIHEAIHQGKSCLVHFHAAEPNLGDFHNPISFHSKAAIALKEINYSGWVAIEMNTPIEKNHHHAITEALDFVKDTYY